MNSWTFNHKSVVPAGLGPLLKFQANKARKATGFNYGNKKNNCGRVSNIGELVRNHFEDWSKEGNNHSYKERE
jgi:hypothetical protein